MMCLRTWGVGGAGTCTSLGVALQFHASHEVKAARHRRTRITAQQGKLRTMSRASGRRMSTTHERRRPLQEPTNNGACPKGRPRGTHQGTIKKASRPHSPLQSKCRQCLNTQPQACRRNFTQRARFTHRPCPSTQLRIRQVKQRVQLRGKRYRRSTTLLSKDLRYNTKGPPKLHTQEQGRERQQRKCTLRRVTIPTNTSPRPTFRPQRRQRPTRRFLPYGGYNVTQP